MKTHGKSAYARSLIQIMIFTAAIATTTLVLHEFGHFLAGNAAGCKNIEIMLLDKNFNTYTQMNCASGSDQVLALSGFLLVVPFALALYLMNGHEKYYSLVTIGFNLIISSSDIALISQTLMNIGLITGMITILYGENLLVSGHIGSLEKLSEIPYIISNEKDALLKSSRKP